MKTEKIVQVVIVVLGIIFFSSVSSELQYVNSGNCIYAADGTRYPSDVITSCLDSSYGSAKAMGLLGLLFVVSFGVTAFLRIGFFSRSNRAANPGTSVSSSSPLPVGLSIPQTQAFDIQQELQKAADMLKGGLIDEDEYKELKKKIISKS